MPTGLGDEKLWLSATNDNTGTSTAFDDQSGSGNNGTASGTLVVADTSNGGTYAFEFDGSNDSIDTGNGSSTDLRPGVDPLTFTAWIKPDTIAGGDTFSTTNPRYVIRKGGTVGGRWQYGWRILGGKPDFFYRNSAETLFCGYRADSHVVSAGVWQHIALVHDGTNATHYLNGSVVPATVSSGSMSTPAYNSSEPVIIGKEPTQRYFDGLMDDVRIYDRALTQDEIAHLASDRGVTGTPYTIKLEASAESASLSSTTTTTSAMDTTSCDAIVLSLSTYNAPNASHLTDSAGNTWTALTTQADGARCVTLFYCLAPTTSATHTFTYGQGAGLTYPALMALGFSGVGSFDSEASGTGSSTGTVQAGALTPSSNDALLVCGTTNGISGEYAVSIDSSYIMQHSITNAAGQNMGGSVSYKMQSTAAQESPTVTISSAVSTACVHAAFLPSITPSSLHPLYDFTHPLQQ